MQKKLIQRFDNLARHYDGFFTRWAGEHELRQIRPLLPEKSSILDYGCGTGRTTVDLLQRGYAVTAYDFSQAMLAVTQTKASKLGLHAEFIQNAHELAGRTWSFITCIGVLDYYPDPSILLRALQTYLSPGGSVVLTSPNALGLLGKMYAIGSRLSIPVYPQTPGSIQRVAENIGFVLESIRYAFPAQKYLGMTIVFLLKSLR